MKWIYLTLAIISETIATSALKESNELSKLVPTLIMIIGYGSSFYFLSMTLREISVGVAYAIWSGIGIFLISLIGYYRFGQKLDTPAMIGIALIILGVAVINLFSKSVSH